MQAVVQSVFLTVIVPEIEPVWLANVWIPVWEVVALEPFVRFTIIWPFVVVLPSLKEMPCCIVLPDQVDKSQFI
mgnify:CR=1 FL=1